VVTDWRHIFGYRNDGLIAQLIVLFAIQTWKIVCIQTWKIVCIYLLHFPIVTSARETVAFGRRL